MSTSRWRDAGSASQDVDPVRVSPDGRIAYWTGGTPGVGTHKFERRSDPAAAKARADELRAALAAKVDPSAHRTLDELAQTMLDEMRESGTPSRPIVETVIAFGSVTPNSAAWSYHACH